MKPSAIVRIKGTRWEAVISPEPGKLDKSSHVMKETGTGNQSKAILLDLAIKHFQRLRLTSEEAKKLALALKKCLKGGKVDVGPIGRSHRIYHFTRKVNAISIRVGEGCIRLPLDAAAALVKPLKHSAAPDLSFRAA